MNEKKKLLFNKIKEVEEKLAIVKAKASNDIITMEDTDVMYQCFKHVWSLSIDLRDSVKEIATIKYGDKFKIRLKEVVYMSCKEVNDCDVMLIKLDKTDKPCLIVNLKTGEVIDRLSNINEFISSYKILETIE